MVIRTLWLCVLEARPVVLLIFLIRFVTAALLGAESGDVSVSTMVLGAVAWSFGVMAVYLLNGVTDATEDRVNNSTRPIAAGLLARGSTMKVAVGSAVVSVTCGATLGLGFLLAAAVFLALGYAYSVPPLAVKRTTGGAAVVVLLGGAVTYLAGFLAGGGQDTLPVALLGGAMSLWMALVGVVAKDFTDVAGDRAARRRTSVIAWGDRRARLVVAGSAVAIGLTFLLTTVLVDPLLTGGAAIVLVGAVFVAARALSGGSPYRTFMVTQYLAHLCVLLTLACHPE